MLQEGGPPPGLEIRLLSEETRADKARDLERGTWAESKRVREPRRAALPHKTHSPGFYGNGFSFQVVSGQSL